MKVYTVTIQWLRWTKRDYKRESVVVRGVVAADIISAGLEALKPYKNNTSSNISAVWYDWPQPNGLSRQLSFTENR